MQGVRCPRKGGRFADAHGENSLIAGAVLPEAWGLPEAGREAWKRPFPKVIRGALALPTS